ncbi:MAG: GNAT family N-acetyltransferase [Anaerolineae bacterium]|nr:GNAT family N-acetyltransferase [Anaerolineae bacterium]
MNQVELLALYDQEQRYEVTFPGFRREAVGSVVRYVEERPFSDTNFVLHSRLTTDNADAVIQTQIDYFRENGRSFEWKLYTHDTPPDLRQRLEAHGFIIGEEEAIMALDLTQTPDVLLQPVTANVRRLTEPAEVADVVEIEEAVWGDDLSSWGERLTAEMREAPDFLSIYVAYADGKPACAGWLNFSPNSQFASLWGGSTRVEYRQRGLYTAVLAARVQEAISRGYRFLTIDASPMSRPIVTRHGFQLLTLAYECNWKLE